MACLLYQHKAVFCRALPHTHVCIIAFWPGWLVVDRRARRAGWALVEFATGVEEVDAAQLRIVCIE